MDFCKQEPKAGSKLINTFLEINDKMFLISVHRNFTLTRKKCPDGIILIVLDTLLHKLPTLLQITSYYMKEGDFMIIIMVFSPKHPSTTPLVCIHK